MKNSDRPPPASSTDAPSPAPADESPVAPVETHQRATACPDWLHAAAAHRERWGLGREISLNAYLAATALAAAHPCGG